MTMTFPLPILIICITSLGFLLITDARAAARKSRSLEELVFGPGRFFIWQSRQITMIFLFMVAVNSEINQQQFCLPAWQPGLALYLLLCGIAVMAGYFGAKRKITVLDFPLTHDQLVPVHYVSYFITRIIYLVLYEIFFRGLLLYACLALVDVKLAIAINISVYSIAHWHSNRQEVIGSLPFGLILCLLTVWYDSVWPAVVLHLSLALSHDLTLVMIKEKIIASSFNSLLKSKT
jgi:membrane protease YdiL (CAAX protease family)